MAYLKFLDSEALHEVKVVPQGNIVTLSFAKEKIVSTAGFNLYLDDGERRKNIGGEAYHGYTTVYRNDEEDEHSYQLSNDGSSYVEPEPIPEPEIPEPEIPDVDTELTEYVSDRQLIAEQNEAILELAELLDEQNDAILELAKMVSDLTGEEEE